MDNEEIQYRKVNPNDVYALKGLRPTKSPAGDYYFSAKRFNAIIDKATERSQINFEA